HQTTDQTSGARDPPHEHVVLHSGQHKPNSNGKCLLANGRPVHTYSGDGSCRVRHPEGGMPGQFRQWTHAVLRIGSGLLFIEHGLSKLFGVMGGFGTPGVTAQLASRFGVAGVLETAGGIFLILGLLTRPIAVVLLAEMVVAFAISHLPR